jgi:hypothetical protein
VSYLTERDALSNYRDRVNPKPSHLEAVMHRVILLISAILLVLPCSSAQAGDAEAPLATLTQATSLTSHGITWTFSQNVPTGQFVNGDYFVVGEVTVISINPPPTQGRNGSVLNLPAEDDRSGFDDRVAAGRWDPSLRISLHLTMTPGDALVSTISIDAVGSLARVLMPSESTRSPVLSASVLTCLASAPPADAFRPSYLDRNQNIFRANDLRKHLLPRLPVVRNTPDLAEFAGYLSRPWIDNVFFNFDTPIEYMPDYGRELGRLVGIASLLLMLDLPEEDQEPLLIGLVQYGIDLWGIADGGHPGWPAHGGHGSGRKWAIVFAGIMLGDDRLSRVSRHYPATKFGEDMQTAFDQCWTGSHVVYAGHVGYEGTPSHVGWGAYEHLQPIDWLDPIGENYRRCCTSISWVEQILAARLLRSEERWGPSAVFDYVDRWMTEDDTQHVATIFAQTGWDYSAGWQRQGQAWDAFVDNM